jgi:hypothetical protein
LAGKTCLGVDYCFGPLFAKVAFNPK